MTTTGGDDRWHVAMDRLRRREARGYVDRALELLQQARNRLDWTDPAGEDIDQAALATRVAMDSLR